MKNQATKSGVKAALVSMGYTSENDTPPALRQVQDSVNFNDEDMAFARYLIYDTDFGGAWKNDAQINAHCI